MGTSAKARARFLIGGVLTASLAACGGSAAPTGTPVAATAPQATVGAAVPTTPAATAAPASTHAASVPAATVPANTGGPVLPTITGTLMLNGTYNGAALAGSQNFTDPIGLKGGGGYGCADFVKGTTSVFGPSFGWANPSVTIAGHAVVASVQVGSKVWKGPGTYHGDDTGLGVDIDNATADFANPGTATADLTINADGSGTLTFAGLADQNGGSGTLGGSATWTCQ